MQKLTIKNLSAPQIEAFGELFPALHAAGLVERKGSTALVITLHPLVFQRAFQGRTAGEQLAASAEKIWSDNVFSTLRHQTVRALAGKLAHAVAEEV